MDARTGEYHWIHCIDCGCETYLEEALVLVQDPEPHFEEVPGALMCAGCGALYPDTFTHDLPPDTPLADWLAGVDDLLREVDQSNRS
jgi:hypothetical protein